MTTPLAHFEAFRDWLDGDPALAGRGHDAAHLDPAKPLTDAYWVLFGAGPESVGDERLSKEQDALSDAVYEYTVRSVAPTEAGALAVASAVFVRAVGARLVVAGRDLGAVKYEGGDPVKFDPKFVTPVFFVDESYSLASRRG